MSTPRLLAVDVGGTFTDVIGVRDDGVIDAIKVPTDKVDTELSVLTGAAELGAEATTVFNHASTVGLNAVITRNLPKIGFLTTIGHRDMLETGRSWRPLEALSDAGWRRSFGDAMAPLIERYLRRGIRERVLADGSVFIGLDEDQARAELERFKKCDIEGLSICLINAYANPVHEVRLREIAAEILGDIPCSISSDLSPLAKEYARASTTVIDVYMKLIYTDYASRLESGLRGLGFGGQLNFADSAAMLLERDYAMRRPFKLAFSGPAAGAVASAHFAALVEDDHLICCDVGGTSSDISMVSDGRPYLSTTYEIEPDMLVNALSVELGTLGAGGGSIVSVAPSGEIAVGPDSAGGEPGPACYGRGGELPTMTDAFVAIGVLDPAKFNAGRMTLDRDLALAAFERLPSQLDLREKIRHATRIGLNNIAEGIIDAAIARGSDPRDFSLVAFGAAGPLMLPSVLDDVKVRRVIVPPLPGLFSALGLLSTDLVYSDSRSAYFVLEPDAAERIEGLFAEMEEDLHQHLPPGLEYTLRRTFDGRLVGQSWETPLASVPEGRIDAAAVESMIASFHDEYESRYGNRFEKVAVEGVTYRVELIVTSDRVDYPTLAARDGAPPAPDQVLELDFVDEEDRFAGEYQRADLRAGDLIDGPAVIREPMSTTYIRAGQQARVGGHAEIVITRKESEGEGV